MAHPSSRVYLEQGKLGDRRDVSRSFFHYRLKGELLGAFASIVNRNS